MHCRYIVLAVGSLILFGPTPAQGGIITVNFESLRHDDALLQFVYDQYIESSFRFAATHPEAGNPHRFNTLGTQHIDFNGSTSLYHGVSNGIITLTQIDGLAFNLSSIELTEMPGNDVQGNPVDLGPFDVSFAGNVRGGGVVTQTIHVTNFLTPTAYYFSGFTNLDSVTWTQGAGGPTSPTHQFDNVRLEAVVPAPGGLPIVLSGACAYLLVRVVGKRTRRGPSW